MVATNGLDRKYYDIGLEALKEGQLVIVSLAGGAGSRWTKGAGVVKSLNPFAKIKGAHRNFIETHLSKTSKISALVGQPIPHVFTTSYLTHEAIAQFLARENNYGYHGKVILSHGRAIGQRMVPTARDLRFEWEEMPQQLLDERSGRRRTRCGRCPR